MRDSEEKADRLHIRMESCVMGWMRKAAAKKRMTVSRFAREIIMKEYNDRHDK